MKGKAIIPLALGLAVGLLAVKLLVDFVKKAQASGSDRQTVAVVRAKQDIAELQEITAELVEVVETPENQFFPAADRISKLEEVVGRVAAKAIPQKLPVLKSLLAPPGTEAGLFGRIKPGFRAVSVKIDEVSGVAYQVKPGDWVDVIVVMDIESGSRGRKKQTIAEVILQHIQVAAIGQVTSGPAGGGADAKVKPAKSATLIVPEDDVPKLHLAGTRGKITLAMRGADEQVTDKPLIAKSDEVFRFASAPDPEPPPTMPVVPTVPTLPVTQPAPVLMPKEAPHGVTVYHSLPQGTKSETVMFENAHSRTILSLSEGPGSRAGSIFGAPNRGKQTQPWQPVGPAGSAPGSAPTTDPNQPGDRGSVRPMNREEAEAVREEAFDAMNESSGSDESGDRNAYPKEDE